MAPKKRKSSSVEKSKVKKRRTVNADVVEDQDQDVIIPLPRDPDQFLPRQSDFIVSDQSAEVLDDKLAVFEDKILRKIGSSVSEALRLNSNPLNQAYQFQFKNKPHLAEQYQCSAGVLQLLKAHETSHPEHGCAFIDKAIRDLEARQKDLRIAESSQGGFNTVRHLHMYEDIASDHAEVTKIAEADKRAVAEMAKAQQRFQAGGRSGQAKAVPESDSGNATTFTSPSGTGASSGKGIPGRVCYSCGLPGHFSRDCTPQFVQLAVAINSQSQGGFRSQGANILPGRQGFPFAPAVPPPTFQGPSGSGVKLPQ